jgi:hypothetical protein
VEGDVGELEMDQIMKKPWTSVKNLALSSVGDE